MHRLLDGVSNHVKYSSEMWAIIILGSIPPIRPMFLRAFRHVSKQGYNTSEGDRSIPMDPLAHTRHPPRNPLTLSNESEEKILQPDVGDKGAGIWTTTNIEVHRGNGPEKFVLARGQRYGAGAYAV